MANENIHRETLVNLLGLQADASDEAIANAASTFQSDMVAFRTSMEEKVANAEANAEESKTEAEAAKQAATEIANEAKVMAEELVNYDLEKFKDVINNSDAVKEQLLRNRAATVALLSNIKTTIKAAPEAPLHNPQAAGQPAPVVNNTAPTPSKEQVQRISNRAMELAKTLGISHQRAWTKAVGEVAKEDAAAPAK